MAFFNKRQSSKPGTAGAGVKKEGFFERLRKQRAKKKGERIRKMLDAARAKQAEQTKGTVAKGAEKIVVKPKRAEEKVEVKAAASVAETIEEAGERRRIAKMAEKAATDPKLAAFANACRKKGLDPKETFTRHCNELMQDEALNEQKFDLQETASLQGKRFSETVFWAKRIMEKFLK